MEFVKIGWSLQLLLWVKAGQSQNHQHLNLMVSMTARTNKSELTKNELLRFD